MARVGPPVPGVPASDLVLIETDVGLWLIGSSPRSASVARLPARVPRVERVFGVPAPVVGPLAGGVVMAEKHPVMATRRCHWFRVRSHSELTSSSVVLWLRGQRRAVPQRWVDKPRSMAVSGSSASMAVARWVDARRVRSRCCGCESWLVERGRTRRPHHRSLNPTVLRAVTASGDHMCGQGWFGGEGDIGRDTSLGSTVGVIDPASGNIQGPVDEGVTLVGDPGWRTRQLERFSIRPAVPVYLRCTPTVSRFLSSDHRFHR